MLDVAINSWHTPNVAEIDPALAEAVEKRRRELGLSPSDLAAATGLTVQGLLPLRKGHRRSYQERLTGPVCRVFGWSADSIERILAGGAPKRTRVSQPVDDVVMKLRAQVDRLQLTVFEHSELLAELSAELKRLQSEPPSSAARSQ